MLAAFVTRSSSAVLPVLVRAYRKNLGVSEKVSSFVLPLGATINMDGTALYQGVCALFVAQAFGIPLSVGAQVGILITALSSIGTAGVPGQDLSCFPWSLHSRASQLKASDLSSQVSTQSSTWPVLP